MHMIMIILVVSHLEQDLLVFTLSYILFLSSSFFSSLAFLAFSQLCLSKFSSPWFFVSNLYSTHFFYAPSLSQLNLACYLSQMLLPIVFATSHSSTHSPSLTSHYTQLKTTFLSIPQSHSPSFLQLSHGFQNLLLSFIQLSMLCFSSPQKSSIAPSHFCSHLSFLKLSHFFDYQTIPLTARETHWCVSPTGFLKKMSFSSPLSPTHLPPKTS